MVINPMDAEGYVTGDHPKWAHSFYFDFYDPKIKVGGFIRIGILEHQRETNTWVVLFMDGKPLYTRVNLNLPYTAGRPDPGMALSGTRLTSIEPLMKVRIEHETPDFKLDLICNGLQPMVDSVAMSKGAARFLKGEMTSIHMEGTIRVAGVITFRGDAPIEIDALGFRDISVGPRNWDYLLCFELSRPVFLNGLSFMGVHAISVDGHNSYLRVWYNGKKWLPVKRLENRNKYAKDGYTIKSLHWRFWDEDDNMWEYTGKPLFSWPSSHDTFVVNRHIMEYRMADGLVGYGLAEASLRLDTLRPGPAFHLRKANTLKPL